MNKSAIKLASRLTAFAALTLCIGCGGSPAPAPAISAPPANSGAATATPVAADLDCTTAPKAMAADGETRSTPFSITNDAESVAAGTQRSFGFSDDVLVSQSEGGSTYISIVGFNQCGLWIKDVGVGSEIAGDADRRDESVALIKTADSTFLVERLGVQLEVKKAQGPVFEVKTLTALEKYEGE